MDDEKIIERLATVEARSKSNTIRLDKLEESNEALTQMAGSLQLLAYQQEESGKKIDSIDKKVTALEAVPAEKWRKLVGYIAAALVSAGVGYLLSYIFR